MEIEPLGPSLCDQKDLGQQISCNELHKGAGEGGQGLAVVNHADWQSLK